MAPEPANSCAPTPMSTRGFICSLRVLRNPGFPYLEGQGDTELIPPITRIVTLLIPIINLLSKSLQVLPPMLSLNSGYFGIKGVRGPLKHSPGVRTPSHFPRKPTRSRLQAGPSRNPKP